MHNEEIKRIEREFERYLYGDITDEELREVTKTIDGIMEEVRLNEEN